MEGGCFWRWEARVRGAGWPNGRVYWAGLGGKCEERGEVGGVRDGLVGGGVLFCGFSVAFVWWLGCIYVDTYLR